MVACFTPWGRGFVILAVRLHSRRNMDEQCIPAQLERERLTGDLMRIVS